MEQGCSNWRPRTPTPPSAETAIDCALVTLTEHADPAGTARDDRADSLSEGAVMPLPRTADRCSA